MLASSRVRPRSSGDSAASRSETLRYSSARLCFLRYAAARRKHSRAGWACPARAKIESLRVGRMPIYEPGLEEMVTRNVEDGRLAFTTDLVAGVRHSDVI